MGNFKRLIFILLLNYVCASEIAADKLIIKLQSDYPRLQVTGIYQTAKLPQNLLELNKKYTVTEIKTYGNSTNKKIVGQSLKNNYLSNYLVLKFQQSQNIEQLIEQYQNLPEVEFAQPVYIYKALTNDTHYHKQKDYLNLISANQAWQISQGNGTVKVAVIDSGIQANHPDFKVGSISGWNFVEGNSNFNDTNGHGTMVAGIIAAVGNNNQGIAGICWDCQLLGLRVLDSNGYGDTQMLIEAIDYAINQNANIINMSLGQPSYDRMLEAACEQAQAAGILLIAAMGNTLPENGIYKETLMYPAAFASVMGVGAVNAQAELADFSVVGKYPLTTEIVAPGVNIAATDINNAYSLGDGTSFAAPFVSAVAALIKSIEPGISAQQLRYRLNMSANDLGRPGKDSIYGYGIVNAYNALTNNTGRKNFEQKPITDLFNFPNPVTGEKTTFIFTAKNDIKQVNIYIYNLRGELLQSLTADSSPAGEYRVDWDLRDKNNKILLNGSYIYIVEIEDSQGKHLHKEILSILR